MWLMVWTKFLRCFCDAILVGEAHERSAWFVGKFVGKLIGFTRFDDASGISAPRRRIGCRADAGWARGTFFRSNVLVDADAGHPCQW